MKAIGTTIRDRRKALGMSATTLAELVGVSVQAVSNWEKRAGSAPGRKHLPKVSKALGIELDDLMGDEEDNSPEEAELMAMYRSLSVQDRSTLHRIARGMVKTRR